MSTLELLSLNSIPFPVFKVSEQGDIINLNHLAENFTGYDKEELIGQKVEILVPGDINSTHVKHRTNYKRNSGTLTDGRNVKFVHKSQEVIPCCLRVSDIEGGFIACLTEINPVASIASGTISAGAKKILNGIEEAFWEWDMEQDIMFFSEPAMALLGHDKVSFSGHKSFWEQHVAINYLDKFYQQVSEHIAGKLSCINITYPLTNKNGENKWVNCTGKILEYKNDQAYKMFGSFKDVTDSQRMIQTLKKSNEYLSLAERINLSGYWRIDLRTKELLWSTGMYLIHGVDSKTYQPSIGSSLAFYGRKEGERIQQQIENAIAQKKGFHCKGTIIWPLGTKIKVESLGEVELDEQGEVIGIFGIFRDVTKAEDTFEKLKLLAMVNYTIKVPIFFIDEQDNIVYQDLSPQISNESSVLFNYVNFTITDYLNFKKEAKNKGQLKKNSISFDNYNTVFDMSITFESDEGIYIWIVENVTDKFRKDQQQIISNRLALLGNTFGNVSHDINNVLGVALGAIEMLELKFSQGEQNISSYISRVKNAIDKGKNVTERLLAFTRKPTVKVVEFDPIEDIKENKYLFKQLLLSTIDFSFNFSDIDCTINFPQGEFINILLNLVLNAQDAIREQGLIGKIEMSANINDGGRLEIHVKDSGIGIKPENLSRIFDPFYSSKSVNKGNGIGLANVYSTVYKHNGQIQVAGECELGGALFTLIFKCKINKNSSKKLVEQKNNLGVSGKSVLILDDELSIAEFVALYLDSEGANAKHVTNKKDLLSTIASNNNFDIFITDMILPDISGRDAVELVLAKFPNIKVYSISGYIAEEDKQWKYPVLRKPFNSKDLAKFLSI